MYCSVSPIDLRAVRTAGLAETEWTEPLGNCCSTTDTLQSAAIEPSLPLCANRATHDHPTTLARRPRSPPSHPISSGYNVLVIITCTFKQALCVRVCAPSTTSDHRYLL